MICKSVVRSIVCLFKRQHILLVITDSYFLVEIKLHGNTSKLLKKKISMPSNSKKDGYENKINHPEIFSETQTTRAYNFSLENSKLH